MKKPETPEVPGEPSEKKPKFAESKSPSTVHKCGECKVSLKYDDKISCLCRFKDFCSEKCLGKSKHYQSCRNDPGDDRKRLQALAIECKKGNNKSMSEFKEDSAYIVFLNHAKEMLQNSDMMGELRHSYHEYQGGGLGGLVASRCKDHLLEIIQDKPGVGLSKDELGFRELHQLREAVNKIKARKKQKFKCVVVPCPKLWGHSDKTKKVTPNNETIKYVVAPEYGPDCIRDLKRVVEGPWSIDDSDHASYACEHLEYWNTVPVELCRKCYIQGLERVRAVASGAYCMSSNYTDKVDGYWSRFSVIYEVEDEIDRIKRKEDFVGYCKEEIDSTLRLLSVHSADVDPRMISINPDLYWSIIWIYGSVTTALKEAGGQRLYEIGFGKHEKLVEPQCPCGGKDDSCYCHDMMFVGQCPDINKLKESSLPKYFSTLENNFVSNLQNLELPWRHCCSHPSCLELEDKVKFLNCGGCVKVAKRKYCSVACQEDDWEEHRQHCGHNKK